MKLAYLKLLERKRKSDSSDEEIAYLPPSKRGRPLMLGNAIEQQLQLYLNKIREQGGVITASVVVAAARGILMSSDAGKCKLAEFGGHINLSRQWAYHFLGHMNYVRRKATTAKNNHSPQDLAKLKKDFLNDVAAVVGMEEIVPELVLNWDQTGIHLVPASSWTMDKEGSKQVAIKGGNDKRQITAVFCGSAAGDFLPLQLVYKGKTERCHPHFQFPPGWLVSHARKH